MQLGVRHLIDTQHRFTALAGGAGLRLGMHPVMRRSEHPVALVTGIFGPARNSGNISLGVVERFANGAAVRVQIPETAVNADPTKNWAGEQVPLMGLYHFATDSISHTQQPRLAARIGNQIVLTRDKTMILTVQELLKNPSRRFLVAYSLEHDNFVNGDVFSNYGITTTESFFKPTQYLEITQENANHINRLLDGCVSDKVWQTPMKLFQEWIAR